MGSPSATSASANSNGNSNATMNEYRNTVMGLSDETREDLWKRYEQYKSVELSKNELIKELLDRYENLSRKHKNECDDHDREREYNRNAQRELEALRNQLSRQTSAMNRDSFVVVLLDGDGMIFQDNLLQEGEIGGRRAASLLSNAVSSYLQQVLPGLSSDVKIVIRLYANFKGLGDALVKAGVISRSSTLEEFFCGFAKGNALFDCVNVGHGKDRADDKLGENFKLYLNNLQCQHIFFGCSHDNGYVRLLDEIYMETSTLQRLTLLEGLPFEREYNNIPIRKRKFPGMFREAKLNWYSPPQTSNPFARVTSFVSSTPSSQGDQSSLSGPARTYSFSSTDTGSASTVPLSWAAAAKKVPPTPDLSPQTTPAEIFTGIQRNRSGQRVDPFCCDYDKEEVARMKRLKLCHVHFLRHDCVYGDGCTHRHDYNPTLAELKTLRNVARLVPCARGSDCDEPKCTYGHICPVPDRKDVESKRGGKTCFYGDNCRFPAEMHGIDKTVVRTTKVT